MNEKETNMHQNTFDFEKPDAEEPKHVALTTSLPPPPLVRPDRQLTYGGASHYEWPKPNHDRDTITVDRIRDDIDGPSHRFVIKRGDTVEVFFSKNHLDVGEVAGISHARDEVRVSFQEGSEGQWFSKGAIYPTLETSHDARKNGVPLSSIVDSINAIHAPQNGFTEADRVPPIPASLPYSFNDYKAFRKAFDEGELTFEGYREQFDRLLQSQNAVVAELLARFNAKELAALASRFGSWQSRRSTKDENAEHIVSKMLSSFLLDGTVSYRPLSGETYNEAVEAKVLAVTAADYAREFEKRQAKANETAKALGNPETFFEFRTFIIEKGEERLSDEQLARYDALHADITRERRLSEAKTTVSKFQSEELSGFEFRLKEGFHSKRECPLFIVQLQTRVERDTFNELNRKAKMLGGWYSSFKRDDAGFQFLERENAERFTALLQGDADRTDVLEARKERKEQSAAERLHGLATELNSRADETIERSETSLQNTARRADIQAGVRGRAFSDQALARTLHSIAEVLSKGEAKYLDGIRHKTHIETLDTALYLAKWARIRAVKRSESETTYAHGRRIDEEEGRPTSLSDIRYAKYPYPSIYKRHLEEAILKCRTAPGAKLASERMAKRIRGKDEYVAFQSEHDVEALQDFLSRAKGAGFDTAWMDRGLEAHSRLQRAGITTIHELRSALREYLPHKAEARGDDPINIAERELIGRKLPGFFPTPRPVIERLLELAQLKTNHRILEPSCGKGDILDAIREEHAEARVHAIELNRSLSDVLGAKGHEVEFGDFLSHQAFYDRILMNPPFEKGQDIEHVRHAYSLLHAGGRLVSVMSEGPFFRDDSKAQEFRAWLSEVDATTEQLPEDAFQGADAFRETGVRTRLVTIDKA